VYKTWRTNKLLYVWLQISLHVFRQYCKPCITVILSQNIEVKYYWKYFIQRIIKLICTIYNKKTQFMRKFWKWRIRKEVQEIPSLYCKIYGWPQTTIYHFCQLAFLSCEMNCLDTHCLSLVSLMGIICVTIVDILQMSQSLCGF
jgi:hypothetical protein